MKRNAAYLAFAFLGTVLIIWGVNSYRSMNELSYRGEKAYAVVTAIAGDQISYQFKYKHQSYQGLASIDQSTYSLNDKVLINFLREDPSRSDLKENVPPGAILLYSLSIFIGALLLLLKPLALWIYKIRYQNRR